MDDLWLPETSSSETRQKYTVTCRCGNEMRVKTKHFGRMCRCTQCRFPIYVTYDNVSPPVRSGDHIALPRVFTADEVPVHWKKGDLLAELYEVRSTLGEGGMGIVYRVYHRGWGKHLAVKCPAARLLGDEEWLDQFEHECETWMGISPHPNIVECFYVRRLAGVPRLFVEFVKGLDLSHMIDQKTLYVGGHDAAIGRMLDTAIQFCRGLHHAHEQNVVHQDVKPSNVLIGENDACKVTDFGLAKVWVSAERAKNSSGSSGSDGSHLDAQILKGLSGGTPTYRSLDHKRYGEVTFKTDIWSWGVSMIEMFAGDIYWTKGSDAWSVLDNLLMYGSRYDIIPAMPKRFESLLRACFQDDPSRRPDTMLDIARELEEIYKEETGRKYPREEPDLREETYDVLNNRAVSMLDLESSETADAIWADILETHPDLVEVIYNRNLRYWKTGQITDSQMVELMYKTCEEQPEDWLAAYLLGRVLVERGDAALGLKLLESLPQTDENKREVAYGLAMAQNFLERDKKLVWEFSPDEIKVSAVALSFDGWKALTGASDGQIRIWEVASQKCMAVLDGHTDRVHSVCLSEEELLVLSASADKTVRTWDPVTGKCLRTMEGHQACVRQAVLSPNAKHALSGSDDATLMLWDARTGKRIRTFIGHRQGVNSVAITRCGNFALSASKDCTLKQWDIWTGECLRTFEGSDSRITSVCVSSDGKVMLSACNRHVQFWSLETGELIRKIRGHRTEIFSVCINESGRYAISATGMGTIKVWDVYTGQCLRSLQGHAPTSLSRDGRFAISSGKVGDFKIWAVYIDEPPFPAQYVLCNGIKDSRA